MGPSEEGILEEVTMKGAALFLGGAAIGFFVAIILEELEREEQGRRPYHLYCGYEYVAVPRKIPKSDMKWKKNV